MSANEITPAVASPAVGATTRQRRGAGKFSPLVLTLQLGLLPVLLGLWQFGATHGWVDPLLARTPGEVWDYLVSATRGGELPDALRATMTAVIVAFVLASLSGVLFGISLALLPRTERVLSPYLDAANAMPRIALAPVFLIYFGIGMSAKVALAVSIVFFIVFGNARAGVLSAEEDVVKLSTIMGSSKLQIFTKIYLPVALPSIFAGLRLGLIYALLGVVASELIASRDGLGMLVARYSGVFEMEGVYGVLLVLAVAASFLNILMRAAERHFLRWQPKEIR